MSLYVHLQRNQEQHFEILLPYVDNSYILNA